MMKNLPGFKMYMSAENEGGSSPAAATTTENPATADSGSIIDVLHYDPFAGKSENDIPEAKPAAKPQEPDNASSGAGNEKASASPSAAAPETKPAASAQPADDQVELYRNLAEHYRVIAENNAPKGGNNSPAQDDPSAVPAYEFNVPDALIAKLTSQDAGDFKEGIVAFAKGIAGAVHAQMYQHLNKVYEPRFQSVPQMVGKAIQNFQAAKAVQEDFYGKYPELNNPAIYNLVRTTGENVAKRLGKKAWDSELREETAKEVKAIIAIAAGGKAPAAAPVVNPPKMLGGGGARPAAPANDESSDIVDTLFGQF